MIEALDHIAVRTADPRAAATGYAAVLGRTAHGARLQLGNMALEIVAPKAPDAASQVASPDLGLVFAVRDLAGAAHRLTRRAVPNVAAAGGGLALDIAATHGVAIGLAERKGDDGVARAVDGHDLSGLDHVVVRTRDPERAVALYGGRLGLDLRLDRTNPERNNRLLFFVCGDLVVEISHDTAKGVRPGPDSIWGLAWRATDLRKAHARMTTAGIGVSEIRAGNRPGTEVFTVKNHTAGVPTLVIGGPGLARR
jgi:catechol 2,3-dioxygenase-like lactoylglutathione lyase family enzyme